MTLDEDFERANDQIEQLQKIIQRQQFIEDRYEELMLAARRCLRYDGVDHRLFNASMRAMSEQIKRHLIEIAEMEEQCSP